MLRFPSAILECLGLALVERLKDSTDSVGDRSDPLTASAPDTVEAELALLAKLVRLIPKNTTRGSQPAKHMLKLPSGLTVNFHPGHIEIIGKAASEPFYSCLKTLLRDAES